MAVAQHASSVIGVETVEIEEEVIQGEDTNDDR